MLDFNQYLMISKDGAVRNMEESIAILKKAASQGVHTMVVLQRYMPEMNDWTKDRVNTKIAHLEEKIKAENLQIKIKACHLVPLYGDMVEDLKNEDLLTLGEEKYVFIELPSAQIPTYTSQVIYDMQLEGYRPVIFHPEKVKRFQEDSNLLYHFVKNGTITVLSGRSLLGKRGKKQQSAAKTLVSHHLTHLISSDASTEKEYQIKDVWKKLSRDFGTETFHVFQENTDAIDQDYNLTSEEPIRIKKRKLLNIFN
ncbi:hypothetical protein F9U64_12345 [Gracilibacillus oryzae]|uniref:Tyrosine-protein phosphatase n=1 Tax=Gracilibacillus oryzae TaxID=1672701 RepID=A0A7C8GSY8_9BACI|nr:CpsB/CapC family capsule biosynthesis tyrosine phosphatase [Gracilibacillus oryzae]KAB8133085.1 hypothetical protein F9U64_12345 [Gracilibacillus oryzae]